MSVQVFYSILVRYQIIRKLWLRFH